MRKRSKLLWVLGVTVLLCLLLGIVLPFFAYPAYTFRARGHLISLLAVPEWGFDTTSSPGYDPVTKKFGYIQVVRHGVYATITFDTTRQPTPDEKAILL